MSKARLVLTPLFVDGQTPAQAAERYGVHRSWVYKLKAGFETDGEAATISRYLTCAGLVVPQPKKRPKSSYIRFQADLPNECWQARHRPDRAGPRSGKVLPGTASRLRR